MMPSESDLLKSLDDEPRKPSTVDINRAIADGRRRHRARHAAGYAGAAAVTAVAVAGASVAGGVFTDPAPKVAATGKPRPSASVPPKPAYTIPGDAGWRAPAATPPTKCTLDRLPAPDGAPMALVSGADPAGRYIVGRSYPRGGGYQAVLWHDGKARKVMLPGDLEESLRDVNSTGTAVGWSYHQAGPVPYVYRDGKVSKLPGVKRGSANAINDAGAIVGEDEAAHVPVVWPSATAKAFRLPVPAGTGRAGAQDIDEDGTTVGTLDDERPYVWFPDGTHRELPMPAIDGAPAVSARAFTIRNGWATGVAETGGDGNGGKESAEGGGKGPAVRMTAVSWNVRTGEVRTSDDFDLRADATNAQGWQVGISKQGRAVLLAGGAPVKLPELAPHKPGGLTNIPSTLSDDGRLVAGQSDDATDTIQAVVWHCT
jgi:uncharacterized membrane protein